MSFQGLAVLLLLVLTIAFSAVLWMALQNQRRNRELEHRERLAMIERGLVPPPDLEPFFDPANRPRLISDAGSRRLGIMLMGIGLSLMLLLVLATRSPEAGVGLGGAVAVLGAAFYMVGTLAGRYPPPLDRDNRSSSGVGTGDTPDSASQRPEA